ncbi:DUF3817 domain-containing protein [Frankia sp. AgB32]|uniref:DUF3817 domain-containing protein n=1 Tax=Frankia sp. AgB32 TaxID=631119 RepID=UPI0034D5EF36
MRAALLRYRVIAYVVGVGLIVLVCIGLPLKYAGGNSAVVAAVGPVHGVLYVVYLAATFDLASRTRMPLPRMVLVMLAGTIPFLSFVAERWVSGQIRGQFLTPPAGAAAPVRPGTAAGGSAGATAR